MKRFNILIFSIIYACISTYAHITSPNGNLILTFSIDEEGRPTYNLTTSGKGNGEQLLIGSSHLGFVLKNEDPEKQTEFKDNEEVRKKRAEAISEKQDLFSGFTIIDQTT